MAARRAYNTARQGVPHRLREIRQRAGLTLEQLGEAVGMTAQTIQKYETEPQRLRVADLDKFCTALDCSRAELIGSGDGLSPEELQWLLRLRDLKAEDRQRILSIIEAWSDGAAA